MSRMVWRSKKHALQIIKNGENFHLIHHKKCLLICNRLEDEEMNIFKKMINIIINNHNELSINYNKKE